MHPLFIRLKLLDMIAMIQLYVIYPKCDPRKVTMVITTLGLS